MIRGEFLPVHVACVRRETDCVSTDEDTLAVEAGTTAGRTTVGVNTTFESNLPGRAGCVGTD